MTTCLDITAADLVKGQSIRGIVMSFFQHSDRIRIKSIRMTLEVERRDDGSDTSALPAQVEAAR